MTGKRYFIYLAYNGAAYHGWQVQPGEETVQGLLEKSMSQIIKESIQLSGAGRTDSGVHASHFVAHFDISTEIKDRDKLLYQLNSYLPNDIKIMDIREVKADSHARFDAISRTYKYFIRTEKDPFANDISTYLRKMPDIERMNKAASLMMNYKDFTSFSKLHTDVKTNNCEIKHAAWSLINNKLVFEIRADRFLRNMVRAIVGTHIDIGTGKMEAEEIQIIIEAKDRSRAGRSVPPEGLFLTSIEYPDTIFID